MKISENFSFEEFTASQTATRKGIRNVPNNKQSAAINLLVQNVMQPIRDILGVPITITSGFRNPALNEAIGGSPRSQHCYGEACDFKPHIIELSDAYRKILSSNILFDQIIYEFGEWIHISYRHGRNRNNVLTAKKENGKTIYLKYEGEL